MDVSRRNTRIPITADARARAVRRMLADDSKVFVAIDSTLSPVRPSEPSAPSTRPGAIRKVPILPEARAKAIRRALRDESKVMVRVTDPRLRG